MGCHWKIIHFDWKIPRGTLWFVIGNHFIWWCSPMGLIQLIPIKEVIALMLLIKGGIHKLMLKCLAQIIEPWRGWLMGYGFFPKQCGHTMGFLRKVKSIWCKSVVCASVPRFCVDPLAEKFLRDRKFAFRLRETGPRRGPWRRCVLACAPCRFSEIRKCAKREGFERCAKSS